jgi:hypothetical protein
MSSKFLRIFLSVAAAAVFVAVGTPARAAVSYSPVFDPEFDGTALFQIGDACLLNEDGIYSSSGDCQVNQIFADFFDVNFPSVHYTGGPQADIGFQVVIVGNQLTQFSTTDPGLSCDGEFCAASYEFFTGSGSDACFGDDPCLPLATLQIGSGTPLRAGYTLERVDGAPEPGTLGLLLGGLGAVWMRKRRKAAA